MTVSGSNVPSWTAPVWDGKRRWIQLDLLRALAVLLVMGSHMRVCPPELNPWLHHYMRLGLKGGWCGVDLFFVLSGFLVSGLLFREYQQRKSLAIGRFLARRGLKIYPGFWLLMIFTVLVAWKFEPGSVSAGEWAAELLFVQNYFDGAWKHTWSLAVEEHFYLLLALLISWLYRRRRSMEENPFRWIPAISLLVFLSCFGFRLARYLHWSGFNFRYHQAPSHLRMDSLMLGVLLSYWYHFQPQRLQWVVRWRYTLAFAGAATLALPFLVSREQHAWMQVVGFSIIAAGSGLLIISMMAIEIPQNRAIAALALVGAYSYSIYLWHYPIVLYSSEIIQKVTGWAPHWWEAAIIYVALSLLVGIAAAKLVEIPVLRWRDRILPAPSSAVPALVPRGTEPVEEPVTDTETATATTL